MSRDKFVRLAQILQILLGFSDLIQWIFNEFSSTIFRSWLNTFSHHTYTQIRAHKLYAMYNVCYINANYEMICISASDDTRHAHAKMFYVLKLQKNFSFSLDYPQILVQQTQEWHSVFIWLECFERIGNLQTNLSSFHI